MDPHAYVGQPSLPLTRSHDPETSRDAASGVDTTALEQLVVLKLREIFPRSLTAEELAVELKVDRVTISPRMRPLADKGLIRDTGQRRRPRTPAGEKRAGAILWEAVPIDEVRPIQIIRLGNGQQVRLGEYVAGWRRCKRAKPGTVYRHGLCGWWSMTREEILQEFNYGLHDRINRNLPWFGRGRKWSDDWQREIASAARLLNTPRLVISWLPRELKARFAERLREDY